MSDESTKDPNQPKGDAHESAGSKSPEELIKQAEETQVPLMRGTEGRFEYVVSHRHPEHENVVLGVKMLAGQTIHEASGLTLLQLVCRIRVGYIDWKAMVDENEQDWVDGFVPLPELLDPNKVPMNANQVRYSVHMNLAEFLKREKIEDHLAALVGEQGWFQSNFWPAITHMAECLGLERSEVEFENLCDYLGTRMLQQVADNKQEIAAQG